MPNLVCTLPGNSATDLILVTAHFDRARAGAIDNWTGASLLPSLFQTMRTNTGRRHTFLFIGFTDEEAGLEGSRAWNRKTILKDARVVVTIDSVASRADPVLKGEAVRIGAALKIAVEGMSADNVGQTIN